MAGRSSNFLHLYDSEWCDGHRKVVDGLLPERERLRQLTASRAPTFTEQDEQQKRVFNEMYGRSHNGMRAAFDPDHRSLHFHDAV